MIAASVRESLAETKRSFEANSAGMGISGLVMMSVSVQLPRRSVAIQSRSDFHSSNDWTANGN